MVSEEKGNWNIDIALLLRKLTLPVVLKFPWILELVPAFFAASELIFLHLALVPSIITRVLDTTTAELTNKSIPLQFNENIEKQYNLGVNSLASDTIKRHPITIRYVW